MSRIQELDTTKEQLMLACKRALHLLLPLRDIDANHFGTVQDLQDALKSAGEALDPLLATPQSGQKTDKTEDTCEKS